MSQHSQPQLLMRLSSLENLNPPVLPEGYKLRLFEESDRATLTHTLKAAFPELLWSEESIGKWLLDDPTVKKVFVIDYEGQVVATASVRYVEHRYPGAGYLHWVGTNPKHQGKKLGMIVSYAVLQAFREDGYPQAVLQTDDFRKSAIAIYLRMGFVPEHSHESHPERWQAVLTALGR